MTDTASPFSLSSASIFKDGLGDRFLAFDRTGGEMRQVLRLRPELSAVLDVVRARAEAVARFDHPCFPRVFTVRRSDERVLALVETAYVQALRVSELFDRAHEHDQIIDSSAALFLVDRLLRAVASFHEKTGLAHGAIGPQRLLLTEKGRVVVADHVFGAAIERLGFSRTALWQELGIPLPLAGTAHATDLETDVAQIALVALAVLQGRQLLPQDYPDRVASLVDGLAYRSALGVDRPFPAPLGRWLVRALGLDPKRRYQSAGEAQRAFDEAAAACSSIPTRRAALVNLLIGLGEASPDRAPVPQESPHVRTMPVGAVALPRPSAAPRVSTPLASAPLPLSVVVPAGEAVERQTSALPAISIRLRADPPKAADVPQGRVAEEVAPPPIAEAPEVLDQPDRPASWRDWGRAAAVALVLAIAGNRVDGTVPHPANVDIASSGERPMEPAVAWARLSVISEPAGARVRLDGRARGTTPLVLDDVTAGRHDVAIEGKAGVVRRTVTVAAGEEASLSVPLYPGWVAIFAPIDVDIYERGRHIARSDAGRFMMGPGRHALDLVNEKVAFRASRVVDVVPGELLPVSVEVPPGVMHVNANPWAAVWIDGESVGEIPLGNLSVPVGTRELVLRHPEFGERRLTALVTLAEPVHVAVDLTR